MVGTSISDWWLSDKEDISSCFLPSHCAYCTKGSVLPSPVTRFSFHVIFTFRYKAACFACSLEQDLNILPNGDQTEVKTITSRLVTKLCLLALVIPLHHCTLFLVSFLDRWTRHKPEWRTETENQFSKSTLLWHGEEFLFRKFSFQCILVFTVLYYLLNAVSVFNFLLVLYLGHLLVGWPVKRSGCSCWATHF